MDVNCRMTIFFTEITDRAKAHLCMVDQGQQRDVHADPSKVLLIPAKQAPRYTARYRYMSLEMTRHQDTFDSFGPTESCVICSANDCFMDVYEIGKLHLVFPSDDKRFLSSIELFLLKDSRVFFLFD